MIKTILFDLDGTLLPMDQDEFTMGYFKYLAAKLAPYGYPADKLVKAIWAGTASMVKNDGTKTNEKAFWDTFCQIFSPKALDDEPIFVDFYKNEFQNAKKFCGFNPKAASTIASLKQKGYPLVLATNPIFPAIATESRIQWAGLHKEDFQYITTYENSHYCKPNPDYYKEIVDLLHLNPSECLMVGNDVIEDCASQKIGINTFILTDCLINKENADLLQIPHGNFEDLLSYIESAE